MKESLTVCSFCGCGCSMCVINEKEEIVNIIPVISNPVNRGSLCIKGWHINEVYVNQNRILKPMIKVNGKFKEAGFKEAYDLIAEKFNEYLKKENSIGVVGSAKTTCEEDYLLNRLTRQVFRSNSIDSSYSLHYTALAGNINALDLSAGMGDVEEADFIMIIGSNIHNEAPQVLKKVIKASDRGAKIAFAGILPVPVADVADIKIMIAPDDFLQFASDLKNTLAGGSRDGKLGEFFNSFALIYKNSKKPVIILGEDIFKGINSVKTFSALYEIFNGKIFPIYSINNILGAVSCGITPYADNKEFEKNWDAKLPETKGLNLLEMLESARDGSLRCLYVTGEDILIDAGDYTNTKKALENLEFMVVQDLFMTETAKLADVILPASGSLEKEGTFINMEGTPQYFERAIEPLGGSRPDSQIYLELSEKMGFKMPYDNIKEITQEINTAGLLKKRNFHSGKVDVPAESLSNDFSLWIKADNRRLAFHSGSLLKNSYILQREMEPSAVLVHPDQAKSAQFRNNEKVRIITKHGEITRNIMVSNDIPKGLAVIRTDFKDDTHCMIMPACLKWTPGRLEKMS